MNRSFSLRLLTAALALGLVALGLAQDDDPAMHMGSLHKQGKSDLGMSTRKACQKGDILTIVVSESANSSFTATTTTKKTDSNTVNSTTSPLIDLVTGSTLKQLLGSQMGTPSRLLSALFGGGTSGGTSATNGTGSSTNSQAFTTTISVVVTEVLPNGNLMIEGQRWLRVNKELQSVVLTAMVRPDDISRENTVKSQFLANAKIEAEGKGQIAERQRKGIVTRILDWLF